MKNSSQIVALDALTESVGRFVSVCLCSIGSHAPMRRKAHRLAVAGLMLWLLAGCAKDDAVVALQHRAERAIAAVSARDHGEIMDLLADDFGGPEGMDQEGASRLARLYFLRFRDISLLAGPLEVAVNGERGSVSFVALLAGGRGGLMPEQAQAWQVKTDWRRDGGDWLMIAADWSPVAQ